MAPAAMVATAGVPEWGTPRCLASRPWSELGADERRAAGHAGSRRPRGRGRIHRTAGRAAHDRRHRGLGRAPRPAKPLLPGATRGRLTDRRRRGGGGATLGRTGGQSPDPGVPPATGRRPAPGTPRRPCRPGARERPAPAVRPGRGGGVRQVGPAVPRGDRGHLGVPPGRRRPDRGVRATVACGTPGRGRHRALDQAGGATPGAGGPGGPRLCRGRRRPGRHCLGGSARGPFRPGPALRCGRGHSGPGRPGGPGGRRPADRRAAADQRRRPVGSGGGGGWRSRGPHPTHRRRRRAAPGTRERHRLGPPARRRPGGAGRPGRMDHGDLYPGVGGDPPPPSPRRGPARGGWGVSPGSGGPSGDGDLPRGRRPDPRHRDTTG